MPNTQGVIVHKRSRNLFIAFSKVLQIWRYEKHDSEMQSGIMKSQMPKK